MTKNQWNFRLSLILIMLILGLGLIKTHPVSAASSIPVDLETGYTYTYYDVTGDGRKDNFTVKAVSLDTYYTGDGYYNAVYLCVNGKGQYIKLIKCGSKTGWINGQKQKNFVSSEQQWFSNLPYV